MVVGGRFEFDYPPPCGPCVGTWRGKGSIERGAGGGKGAIVFGFNSRFQGRKGKAPVSSDRNTPDELGTGRPHGTQALQGSREAKELSPPPGRLWFFFQVSFYYCVYDKAVTIKCRSLNVNR